MPLALNTIHQTDCLKALAKVTPGSVDLAFADPPFNIGYEYDEYDDERERDDYLAWSRQWIGGVHQALKPSGTFWLAIGDEYAAELKILSQEIGFHCRSWVVWYYTFGVNCVHKFTRSHAHLFYFIKDLKKFTFNASDPNLRVPSARQLVYNDSRGNPDGRLPDDTWILRPQDLVDGFTPDENTWHFPRVNGTFKERAGFHGCQMPEQLLGRVIRSCSHAGELVLDPFSGSATSLVVAKKMGRQWLGFELSKDYAKRGLARLDAVNVGDELEGAPEPRVSAPATPKSPKERRSRKKAEIADIVTADQAIANGLPKDQSRTPAIPSAVPPTLGKQSRKTKAKVQSFDLERGLVQAFRATCRGFSVDRVVADPELDGAFLAKCARLSLPGQPAELNRALFRMRKAGKLISIPTRRRTEYDWMHVDKFIFASEIAWRRMSDATGQTLDGIFCDPGHAASFDEIARRFSPGFTSLEYRWAALKLRKESKRAQQRAHLLTNEGRTEVMSPNDVDFEQFKKTRGVYLISSAEKAIYAGESLDLGLRLFQKFRSPAAGELWHTQTRPVRVEIFRHEDAGDCDLIAYQFRLISQRSPAWNCMSAGAA